MGLYTITIIACCLFVFGHSEKRQTANTLALLDKNSTHTFDVYVRREILFLVLNRINETNNAQLSSSTNCENKLKTTVESCQRCLTNSCSSNNYTSYTNTLKQLIPTIFKPALQVSNFIDKMGSSLSTAIEILGEESGLFLKGLAQMSTYLGTGLMNGGSSSFTGIASGLESLGKKLTSLSKDIVLVPLNTLPDLHGNLEMLSGLGSGFQTLINQVGHGFTSIGNALKDLGDKVVGGIKDAGETIKNTGSQIGNGFSNAFHSIFGKRTVMGQKRDCTYQCSDCNKVDLKAHDAMTVLALVCGEEIIYNQRNTLDQVKYLQGIYNNTLEHVLITKIEYDPLSIKTANRIAFSKSYMTYTVQNLVDKFKSEVDFEISDLKTTAKGVAQQIWRLMN